MLGPGGGPRSYNQVPFWKHVGIPFFTKKYSTIWESASGLLLSCCACRCRGTQFQVCRLFTPTLAPSSQRADHLQRYSEGMHNCSMRRVYRLPIWHIRDGTNHGCMRRAMLRRQLLRPHLTVQHRRITYSPHEMRHAMSGQKPRRHGFVYASTYPPEHAASSNTATQGAAHPCV